LQEQVNRESLAISVKAAKLTGRTLAKAFAAVLRRGQKAYRAAQTPQGRQSVKKLMNHKAAVESIDLTGDAKLFEKVARQFNVDYSFHKTGPDKYLLLFKSAQAAAVTQAFKEYTKAYVERAKDARAPIAAQVKQAAELVKQQKPKEITRKREVARE
jgi:hypothetical protein